MLKLKQMKWDNCFSYGNNNQICFDENPLTQLVGSNGAGKTSISLMLQEVLYGKNSKNIKKQDIGNNKSGEKGYYIELDFQSNGIDYKVTLDRKSSLKLNLFEDGKNISSHTSLNTYKQIAQIIGIDDFKVFCQLIYQHSTDSLDFLTATDTNRKRFLINLLQLEKYIEYHELFKEEAKQSSSKLNRIEGELSTVYSWIEKHANFDFVKQDLLDEEQIPSEWYEQLAEVKKNIANINSINKKIIQNNEHKKELSQLDEKYYLGSAPAADYVTANDIRMSIRILDSEVTQAKNIIKKLEKAKGTCPSCLQEVNEEVNNKMIQTKKDEVVAKNKTISELKVKLNKVVEAEAEIRKYRNTLDKFKQLNQVIDNDLSSKTLDLDELRVEQQSLQLSINQAEERKKIVAKKNQEIAAHNSKVDVVKRQLEEMNNEVGEKEILHSGESKLNSMYELLKKTFGTNGLVSYKIESSVKELEIKINQYLSELTHYQIYFKLAGEKLNIEVLDDMGNVTSISNLSSGERARVNISTILAIRNILSSLTNTKINLLFLDEVIGVIDAEGKEKLSEVLLQESLNTFIVSHDWSHPLIPRINIVKEKHISRIEND